MKIVSFSLRRAGVFTLLALAFAARVDGEVTQDYTLTDCLKLAIDHNPDLRKASEQYLSAQGAALRLHAILYPTVNAQALTAPTTLYVQINQVLYSRATFPQLRISRLAQDQAVINYRQTLDDVVFQVRQAFANALGARKTDELIHDYITRQSGSVNSAQQLFQAGRIQKSEVLSVQVTQDRLAQQAVGTQLSVAQGIAALSNLVGVPLPAGTRLVGELEKSVPRDLDPQTLSDQALRDRADLKLLESLHLSVNEQILVDRKNALPTIGFSSNSAFQPPSLGGISDFDLERNYNEPEVQRQQGNSQLPLSLYITWLIFDGGAMDGIAASDRAQLSTQQTAIDALRRSIPGEVTAAIAAVRAELATQSTYDSHTSSDDLRKSAELDYQAGRIRQVDRVNVENDLLSRDTVRLTSEIRLSLALAALDHAMGRGLLTKPTPTPSLHP